MFRKLILLSGSVLLGGCSWPVRESTDQAVAEFVNHPFDISPEVTGEAKRSSRSDGQNPESTPPSPPSLEKEAAKRAIVPTSATQANTKALIESDTDPARRRLPLRDGMVQTVSWVEPKDGLNLPPRRPKSDSSVVRTASTAAVQIDTGSLAQPKLDLSIPPRLPGSEAPRIKIPIERDAGEREIQRIYPELPPLPTAPKVVPGPGRRPYTLADLQRMAAENSPTLKQAAADVETAKGNLIQAKTYPNPTATFLQDPTDVNNTAGTQGGALEQIIKTGGKLRLGAAAAQKDLDNAILALKRARSDLSTAVRTAYFAVLVDVETLEVNRALAQFSDDIFRLQVGLQKGTQAAPYEPSALRAQTNLNRLAYQQSIASYINDWKVLVATLGLPQLPLSEIAGQVDRFIPYYDFDEIRARVLQQHTDVLTAGNGVKKAQFLLKLAQVTPLMPDLDLYLSLEKNFVVGPFGTYQENTLGFPVPVWDQNKGNIIAAQGALLRASEESHRVELALTSGLALAYEGYRNNLYAIENYRRYILPDLVRYYRGIFARRQIDPTSAFGDLVFAQQNLSTNVTTYLGILSSLWSSVVGVADYLQTDDLFQFAQQRALPELPDLSQLPRLWPCGHAAAGAAPLEPVEPAAAAPGIAPAPGAASPRPGGGVETAAWTPVAGSQVRGAAAYAKRDPNVLRTAARLAAQIGPGPPGQPKLDLTIPGRVPGSEAPRIQIPDENAAAEREIARIYPELMPLPVEPKVVPGPEGKPFTLADLQRLAAANSPALRQAAADVEAAKGNLIQAKTYPNPTLTYMNVSSNNTNTAMATGGSIEQFVTMGGKLKLGAGAAQKSLDNAILALKRARSDLSTEVRSAYFTVLVDVETLVVTRAQARLADDIFQLQVGLQKGTQAAPYEPTALRAQAFTNRLAYKQAIASYIYDWKALVATIGLPQLPLSEIAGRVDRLVPYYDYDEVLAQILRNHTDVLTAQNGVKVAQYNLKLAQVTPLFPDFDFRVWMNKDFGNPPHGTYQDIFIGFPVPIWDQNKGNIIAAQAALVRASEESHRVQVSLTSGLALAYESYRNNLYAIEYYRRYILPDLVRYYRGVFARRQFDRTSSFGDLVFAQQNFSTNVTAYIGILGSLWSSVVSVADYLQTDDLFQMARPREVPEVPDLSKLPPLWVCDHGAATAHPGGMSDRVGPAVSAGLPAGKPAAAGPDGLAVGGAGLQPHVQEAEAPSGSPPSPEWPAGPRPAAPAEKAPQPLPPGTRRDPVPPPRPGAEIGQAAAKSNFGKGGNHDGQDS